MSKNIVVIKVKRLTDKSNYTIAECKVLCCDVEALKDAPLHPPDVLDLDRSQ